MPRFSQETLTIIGATIALAAVVLTSNAGVRGEIQNVREELRTEIRDVRTEIREVRTEVREVRTEALADRDALRAEARADREALRAEARLDREVFQSHIIRLTEQQGILRARLDGLHEPPAETRQARATNPHPP